MFPAYTWGALEDEDPAFMRAILIRAIGSRRNEEVPYDDEPAGVDGPGDH